ncbi:MAG: hypothetical protein ACI81I_001042 [Arcobacteraceae bacterium]|jgi:hypothetical protein
MKFYFDTNSVRQFINLKNYQNHSIFTSELAIHEIISGINSEEEYKKRKSILTSIQNSNIEVLWQLPRTVMIEVFDLEYEDTDVKATEVMMNEIIKTNSYNEIFSISYNLGGEDYTINTFIDFDNHINQFIQSTINEGIQFVPKEDKKEMREGIELSPSYVQVQMEMTVRNILMSEFHISDINDDRYMRAVNSFSKNRKLDNYMKSVFLSMCNRIAQSQDAGKNDGFDYWHLVYSSNIDYFVSDDKFYKRLPVDILDINFINSKYFLQLVKTKD